MVLLKFLYPVAQFLIKKTKIFNIINQVYYSKFRSQESKEECFRDLGEKVSVLIFISVVFMVIICISKISENSDTILQNNQVIRPNVMQDSKQVNVGVDMNDNHDVLNLEVENRQFTEAEWLNKKENIKEYLKAKMLGQNKSLDQISEKLNFIKSVSKPEVTFEYKMDSKYIQASGEIQYENITEVGVTTFIEICMRYKKFTETFQVPVKIFPIQYTEEEKTKNELLKQIKESESSSKQSESFSLPTEVNGMKVSYDEENESNTKYIYMLFFIVIFAMPLIWIQEEKERLKKRDQELKKDYPVILNQYTLLLGAGMTIKGSTERIVVEYEKRRVEQRTAYEELKKLLLELKNGVSELAAFEHFGKKISCIPYLKFSTLITQNLQKGSKELLDLLEYEAMDAFENRKNEVKKKGEEAGTKLLMPMMIMLVLVLTVIMIPAFITL